MSINLSGASGSVVLRASGGGGGVGPTGPTGPTGPAGASAGSRQPLDANHILAYYCNEVAGTSLANSVTGNIAPLTAQGTYKLANKGLFAHGTDATLWTGSASSDGAYASGQSISIGSAFTIELCMNWFASPSGGGGIAFELSNDARNVLAMIGLSSSEMTTSIYSSAAGVNTGAWVNTSVSVPSFCGLTHVALVRDGASQKHYINGFLASSVTLTGSSPSAPLGTISKISMANAGSQNLPFRGRIAEVRVSNIARSQAYIVDSAQSIVGL